MSTIKAICFDLDGVYFTPRGKNSFHQGLVTEYGLSQDVADSFMYKSPEMSQLVRGQISIGQFWNRFRTITGITASDQELAARWIRDYEVNQDVKSVVRQAKELGYKTCVCTNNNPIRLPPLIDLYNLKEDFDCIVSSYEVGHTKPSKEIFEELLRRLDVKPEELLYSDDNPERLSGANELGIKTFVFEDFNQFKQKLKEYGVSLE